MIFVENNPGRVSLPQSLSCTKFSSLTVIDVAPSSAEPHGYMGTRTPSCSITISQPNLPPAIWEEKVAVWDVPHSEAQQFAFYYFYPAFFLPLSFSTPTVISTAVNQPPRFGIKATSRRHARDPLSDRFASHRSCLFVPYYLTSGIPTIIAPAQPKAHDSYHRPSTAMTKLSYRLGPTRLRGPDGSPTVETREKNLAWAWLRLGKPSQNWPDQLAPAPSMTFLSSSELISMVLGRTRLFPLETSGRETCTQCKLGL